MDSKVGYNTFYFSWHDAMSELTDEQYGRVSRALNDYCFFGKETELKGIERAIFKMAIANIDSSNEAKINGKKGGSATSEAKASAARENGIKGGAPEGNRNASNRPENNPSQSEKQPKPPIENNPSKGEGEGEGEGEEEGKGEREERAQAREDVSQEPEPVIFPEKKYPMLDWKALYREVIAAGFPDPGGEVRFCTGGYVFLPFFDHLTPQQIFGAIRNYGKVKAMPATWWDTNPTFRAWCEKHLELFLPENFKQERFAPRAGPDREKERTLLAEKIFGGG